MKYYNLGMAEFRKVQASLAEPSEKPYIELLLGNTVASVYRVNTAVVVLDEHRSNERIGISGIDEEVEKTKAVIENHAKVLFVEVSHDR